ncbi:hypothetical protein HPB48_003435 [Haemaphysalis longicornis]|uniref:Uncharacterized protein n=1 Tax=Haemaphysalis longicornis TaxID=44386 RepID=A0A9J6GCV6_HAELO|nr:hypothetical protein HPB48_003435 [Haemaphysalis longicornis]
MLAALRRKVHQYFIRNEAPTAEKILSDVTSDPDMVLPKLSVRTMRRLLNDIGFAFRNENVTLRFWKGRTSSYGGGNICGPFEKC